MEANLIVFEFIVHDRNSDFFSETIGFIKLFNEEQYHLEEWRVSIKCTLIFLSWPTKNPYITK